jgi:hypothetical protein
MSASAFEAFLVRIYVDAEARARFTANPRAEVERAGLTGDECEALMAIDWLGLEMTARSFARKREARQGRRGSSRIARAFRALFRALRISRGC